MMKKSLAILSLAFSGHITVGCAPITAASRPLLSEADSTLRVNVAPEAFKKRVVAEFERRGYQLVDKKATTADSYWLKFKGHRQSVTTVTGGGGGKYAMPVSGSTDQIGSVFFVKVSKTDDGATTAYMLGKPTGNSKEVCSDFDVEEFPCENVVAGADWHGRQQMTGREEADVIRSIILHFDDLPAEANAEPTS